MLEMIGKHLKCAHDIISLIKLYESYIQIYNTL